MSHPLPPYRPPNQQRAGLAAGLAPILVLLAFTVVVMRWMDPETGLAVFAACTVWVVHEMHSFQRSTDRYNAEFVQRHLAWRSCETLRLLAAEPATCERTRQFVSRFLDAKRQLLPDGQIP
jgi:hypothetical protein